MDHLNIGRLVQYCVAFQTSPEPILGRLDYLPKAFRLKLSQAVPPRASHSAQRDRCQSQGRTTAPLERLDKNSEEIDFVISSAMRNCSLSAVSWRTLRSKPLRLFNLHTPFELLLKRENFRKGAISEMKLISYGKWRPTKFGGLALLLSIILGFEWTLPIATRGEAAYTNNLAELRREFGPDLLGTTSEIVSDEEWPAVVLKRPLFSPGRRPTLVLLNGSNVAKAPSLSGIVLTPNEKVAIFRTSAGKFMIAKEGDVIGFLKILSINADQVKVNGPDGIELLRIHKFDSQMPAAAEIISGLFYNQKARAQFDDFPIYPKNNRWPNQ